MVMAAKALLDKNPDPTEEEIKEAMKGNLCRCTGYVKILEAVKVRPRWRKEEDSYVSEIPKNGMIGKSVPVRDAAMKVTGDGYVADMKLPECCMPRFYFHPFPMPGLSPLTPPRPRL